MQKLSLVFSSLALIGVLCMVPVGYKVYQIYDKLDQVGKLMEEPMNLVKDLKAKFNGISTQVDAVTAQGKNIQGKVSQVEGKFNKLEDKIKRLEDKIKGLEDKVKKFKGF